MQVNSNYRQNIISYENKQKSNGTPTFAQYVTEKNEERLRDETATDFEERVLQSAGPNAPQSVKDAWMETVKEVGDYYGLSNSTDILGNSVESAMRATQKALYDFDHPLEPNRVISIEEQQALVKERQFSMVHIFCSKLEKERSTKHRFL